MAIHRILVIFLIVQAYPPGAGAEGSYGWLSHVPERTIETAFDPPPGFIRTEVAPSGFAGWLRGLPLLPAEAVVRDFSGQKIRSQSAVAAVIDLDVGRRDLQQCADSIIRLRAEYLRWRGNLVGQVFSFTSGDQLSYTAYLAGRRPVVTGRNVSWKTVAEKDDDRTAFRTWLDIIFIYAGTISLTRDLAEVDWRDARIGDVIVAPGSPGHAVIIVDSVRHSVSGEKFYLLAQGYMPAQSMHVIKNPDGDVWYRLTGQPLKTPNWDFQTLEVRRFNE